MLVGQLFELSGGFVLLCHMLGMSSIRVKFSRLLFIHARFQRGSGADPCEITYYRVP